MKTGSIYKIECNITREIYIGSTFEPSIARRIVHHRKKTNRCISKQIIDRGDYIYGLLETVTVSSRDELRMKEREWFDKTDCINKNKPFVSKEEQVATVAAYTAAYYTANKQQITAYNATYRAANKEKIAARDAAYHTANKEQKAAYRAANKDKFAARDAANYAAKKAAKYIKLHRDKFSDVLIELTNKSILPRHIYLYRSVMRDLLVSHFKKRIIKINKKTELITASYNNLSYI